MPTTLSIITAINTAIKRGFVPTNDSVEQDYTAALQWLRDNPTQRMTRVRGRITWDFDEQAAEFSLPIAGEVVKHLIEDPYNPDTDRFEYIAQDEDGRLYLVTE